MNSDSAIFCFGEENMNYYEENEKRKDGAKNTILRHLCALRKDGARLLFAQIKACAVHKAQSFALRSH
jgi:hypothetical protein